MKIYKAAFIESNTDYKKCPEADKPEYAFIGRSNVGKSSLLNKLTNHNNLAKTSQTPGKTQLINHFLINDAWYLVDLPGYGFAKTSKTNREKWNKMIRSYLKNRENLLCIFQLIDSRIPPQENDLAFMRWLGEFEIPFAIIFTKIDKQSSNSTQSTIAQLKKEVLKSWEEFPSYFVTSAVSGKGCDEILEFVEKINMDYQAQEKI